MHIENIFHVYSIIVIFSKKEKKIQNKTENATNETEKNIEELATKIP